MLIEKIYLEISWKMESRRPWREPQPNDMNDGRAFENIWFSEQPQHHLAMARKMQILRSHASPAELETVGAGSSNLL